MKEKFKCIYPLSVDGDSYKCLTTGFEGSITKVSAQCPCKENLNVCSEKVAEKAFSASGSEFLRDLEVGESSALTARDFVVLDSMGEFDS